MLKSNVIINILLAVSLTVNIVLVVMSVQDKEEVVASNYNRGYEEGVNACKTEYARALQTHGHIDIRSPQGIITLTPE